MTLWEERAARNEVVFRHVNEEVADLGQGSGTGTSFVCECSDTSCIERIDVPLELYEAVRANPRRFLVKPGHEHPELEPLYETLAEVPKPPPASTRFTVRVAEPPFSITTYFGCENETFEAGGASASGPQRASRSKQSSRPHLDGGGRSTAAVL